MHKKDMMKIVNVSLLCSKAACMSHDLKFVGRDTFFSKIC